MAPTILLVVFFWIIKISYQKTLSTLPYYVGAVVEYHPMNIGENYTEFMIENANQYIKFIQSASEHGADIIVFPEYGLLADPLYLHNFRHEILNSAGTIPDPEYGVLCNDPSSDIVKPLKMISCAAKQHAIYVVINLHEVDKYIAGECDRTKDMTINNCNYLIYNTNVVFDRNGTVISKYRKWHLFNDLFNRTTNPEMSYFHTDFNVTFGHFIGRDIIYKVPAYSLVSEKEITDIVYTADWFSELPYHSSCAIQSGYSYYNNVNLLASNFNTPLGGRSGSGIYAGKNGVLGRIWSDRPINAMIIARVPKIIDGHRIQPIHSKDVTLIEGELDNTLINNSSDLKPLIMFREDLLHYKTKVIRLKRGTRRSTLCDKNICCHFKVNIQIEQNLLNNSMVYYRYRYAVFSGSRVIGNDTIGFDVCSIISCTSVARDDCGKRFITQNLVSPITFRTIEIRGEYLNTSEIVRYPVGETTKMQPLTMDRFTFITENLNQTHINIKLSSIKPWKNLMTFAIYGRNFKVDN